MNSPPRVIEGTVVNSKPWLDPDYSPWRERTPQEQALRKARERQWVKVAAITLLPIPFLYDPYYGDYPFAALIWVFLVGLTSVTHIWINDVRIGREEKNRRAAVVTAVSIVGGLALHANNRRLKEKHRQNYYDRQDRREHLSSIRAKFDPAQGEQEDSYSPSTWADGSPRY